MKTLQLQKAIRPVKKNQTPRSFLDFIVSGQSLKSILGLAEDDKITPFGWAENKEYERHLLKVITLEEKSELKTGRVMLYVCPECGDIDCGAITAIIQDCGDRIIWKDFGNETNYEGIAEMYTEIEPIEFEKENYFKAFSTVV